MARMIRPRILSKSSSSTSSASYTHSTRTSNISAKRWLYQLAKTSAVTTTLCFQPEWMTVVDASTTARRMTTTSMTTMNRHHHHHGHNPSFAYAFVPPSIAGKSMPKTTKATTATATTTATTTFTRSLYTSPTNVLLQQQQQQHNDIDSNIPTKTEEKLTHDALKIVTKAIEAVNPYNAVKNHFYIVKNDDKSSNNNNNNILRIGTNNPKELNLDEYNEIILVAFGKASSAMATAVLQQLEEEQQQTQSQQTKTTNNDDNSRQASSLSSSLRSKKCSGVVICKDDHATMEELDILTKYGIQVKMASHPVPDERSAEAASTLLDLVQTRTVSSSSHGGKALVICCISGGGSALFCKPQSPLTLQDLQQVNSILLASGMGIQEMNVIRKRLEEGKGGRLAAQAYPSQLITLVLSDVLGDPLDLIASGPTVPDTSTWKDAWDIVQRYQLQEKLPNAVLNHLLQGRDGKLPDSPSEDDPAFQKCITTLVGNNAIAVAAAAEEARKLGYEPAILGTQIEGEAKEIARFYTGMALYLQQQQQGSSLSAANAVTKSLPAALIAGGETTVTLTPGSGKGGRNQELALAAALQMKSLNLRNVVLASVGTDGTDGPTDAAGAVVNASTIGNNNDGDDNDLSRAREALSTHNAYPYFDQLATKQQQQQQFKGFPPPLVKTGPTGTNVADVCVTLIGPAESSS